MNRRSMCVLSLFAVIVTAASVMIIAGCSSHYGGSPDLSRVDRGVGAPDALSSEELWVIAKPEPKWGSSLTGQPQQLQAARSQEVRARREAVQSAPAAEEAPGSPVLVAKKDGQTVPIPLEH